jgi:beta-glucosidase
MCAALRRRVDDRRRGRDRERRIALPVDPGVADSAGVPQAVYSEGLLLGYRWYDAKHIAPLFPFGFGLSYTTFSLHGLHAAAASGRGRLAKVSFDVTNTGSRAGAEVPQVYVADPRSTGEPPKQLKAFTKVSLKPRASGRVTLALGLRSFAHSNTSAHRWQVTPGCYRILVGSSSRDLPLSSTVAVGSSRCAGGAVHVSRAALRRAATTS